MAEGALASSEGAFHTLSTSLSGAVEKIAGRAMTVGWALIEEVASIVGPSQTGDPLHEGTGGRHRIGAANRTAGASTSTGRCCRIEGRIPAAGKLLREGAARSFRICWNAKAQKQNRATLKAEQPGSAFFHLTPVPFGHSSHRETQRMVRQG